MSNDNYMPAISGFERNDEGNVSSYYVAASVGDFNTRNLVDGSFAAFATFYLRGDVVSLPDADPSSGACHLWGNLSGNTGWALRLTALDNALFATVNIGTGVAVASVSAALTAVVTPLNNSAALIERLIMAALWFDGANLYLSLNGNIAAPALPIGGYGVSLAPPRMGLSPANSLPAVYADILSVGFYNGPVPLSTDARIIGSLAGQSFRAARESFGGGGLLLPDGGLDWTHRYTARSIAPGKAPSGANVTKNAFGLSITSPALANVPIPDVGRSGSLDVQTGLRIALNPVNDVDEALHGMFITGQKNMDWFHGGGIGAFDASGGGPLALGAASTFAILGMSGIAAVTTPNVVTGDIGVSPAAATAITGFALALDGSGVFATSAQVTGQVFAADYNPPTPGNMTAAIAAMIAAYTDAANRVPANYTELGAGNISGMTLTPGVYKWAAGVLVNTNVTLNGGAADVFIFQIGTTLTSTASADIVLSGGVLPANIIWQVGTAVALSAGSHWEGTILSGAAITLLAGASINGRLLSQTAVNLNTATVNMA